MGKSSAAKAPKAPAGDADAEVMRARKERGARLLAFFADPPAEILGAADALGRARAKYGDDTERELADLEAKRHPLQRRRKTTPR
jgi:hypothetical protein